jgi:hypothetical protein
MTDKNNWFKAALENKKAKTPVKVNMNRVQSENGAYFDVEIEQKVDLAGSCNWNATAIERYTHRVYVNELLEIENEDELREVLIDATIDHGDSHLDTDSIWDNISYDDELDDYETMDSYDVDVLEPILEDAMEIIEEMRENED